MEEIWKETKDYPEYEVSNLGQVRRKDTKRLLKQSETHSGTMAVPLSIKGRVKFRTVHILVAFAFLDNPHDLFYVHHKDGNKKNNCVDNLEWYARPGGKTLKKVYQYDLDWNFLREYPDARTAGFMEDIPSARITACCNMGCSKTKDSKWSYYPPGEREKHEEEYYNAQLNRDICQYDRLDNFIRTWAGVKEASDELGIPPWKIIRCCEGRGSYAGGYGWEFADKVFRDF